MAGRKSTKKRGNRAEEKANGKVKLSFSEPADSWDLRLYIAGQTPKSMRALDNLRRICEEHLAGQYTIEVVDLLVNPRLAKEDQIIAIPTLVRKLPDPIRKIIGDLSDSERTLVGLQLRKSGN